MRSLGSEGERDLGNRTTRSRLQICRTLKPVSRRVGGVREEAEGEREVEGEEGRARGLGKLGDNRAKVRMVLKELWVAFHDSTGGTFWRHMMVGFGIGPECPSVRSRLVVKRS